MANGQEKGQQNFENFRVWAATQSDDDFKQIIYRGQLNRGDVAKALGCGKSALQQNPPLKTELEQLENTLRERGVLPELTDTTKAEVGESKLFDGQANKRLLESRNASKLEQENIELKAEIKRLELKLERFSEMSETIADIGFIAR